MPLVRIDIGGSSSPEVRGTICDAVYDVMTSTSADGHDHSHIPIDSPLKQTHQFSTGMLPGRWIGSWHEPDHT
jgi:hypothetical protein